MLRSRDEFVATTVVDSGAESDIASSSEVSSSLPAEQSPREEFPDMDISKATIRAGFASLDEVDFEGIFLVRACVMKSAPAFLKGAHCSAMRVALREADQARDSRDIVGQDQGLEVVSALLLHRPPRGGLVPKICLFERFSLFATGHSGCCRFTSPSPS